MSRNLARNSKFGLTNVHTEAISSSDLLSTSSIELSGSPVSGRGSQSSASSASSLAIPWLPYVVRVIVAFLGCCLGYQITCFCLRGNNKIKLAVASYALQCKLYLFRTFCLIRSIMDHKKLAGAGGTLPYQLHH